LTRKNTFYCRYGVFKVRVSSSAHEKTRPTDGLSKLNSVESVEVDVVPGEPVDLDGPKAIEQSRRLPE
jgi:hypothetical protein